jgi:hypothetical protein
MEELRSKGMVKSIGVCNFMPHHLDHLISNSTTVPVVNQIELHPLFTQRNTLEYCRKKDIAVMAYTPLGRMNPALISNPLLESLARKHGKTVPQIILRWHIQSGFIVIPKSESPVRIQQNGNVFDFCLSSTDMAAINALNCDMRFRFDPDDLSRYPLSLPYRFWLRARSWAGKRLLAWVFAWPVRTGGATDSHHFAKGLPVTNTTSRYAKWMYNEYKLDEKRYPKSKYWDQFAKMTNAVTIHFKDVPELSNFDCPDASHLDFRDAPRFTISLGNELRRLGVIRQ